MDFANLLVTALAVGGITVLLHAANRAALPPPHHPEMLVRFLRVFILLSLLSLAPPVLVGTAPAAVRLLFGAVGIALLVLLWFFVVQPALRIRLRAALPNDATYTPDSPVHSAAVVFAVLFVLVNLSQVVSLGGVEGLAESLGSSRVSLVDVLLNQGLWLLAAAIGVGVGVRRTLPAALARLGLRRPSPGDLAIGALVGVMLVGGLFIFTFVWLLLTSPEEFAAQTAASSQLARSFDSLPSAFLLSLMVAFGEEVFFRGAVQPAFGNVTTSIFFILLHTQYTLTPATIALFGASLVFGWLRTHFGTPAAIAAHFIFNFVQLALASAAGG
jgi:membrane protease YdiL (CAAX protease family)